MEKDTPSTNGTQPRLLIWLPLFVAIGGLFGWVINLHDKSESLQKDLIKIQITLTNTKAIHDLLPQVVDGKSYGVLGAYIMRSRKTDSVGLGLDFQRLATLIADNAKIISYLDDYTGNELTPAFATTAKKYSSYAADYANKFNALPDEINKSGLDEFEPFPIDFPIAVEQELKQRQELWYNKLGHLLY